MMEAEMMTIMAWVVVLTIAAKLRRRFERKQPSEWSALLTAARKNGNRALMFEQFRKEWVPQPVGIRKPLNVREN